MPEIRDIIITTKVNYGSIIVNIKDLMDSKGISRSRLARMTGIRYSMINRYYKNGDALQRIDLDVFSRICYALDCPLDSIMKYCPPDADDPISPEQLDLIVCSTVQGDHITPATACIIAGGIRAKCPAFDINAACAGFVFAMDIAEMYLRAGHAKHILIVGAEAVTRIADWSDRASCVLFGDGAGAVVAAAGENYLSSRLTTTSNTPVLYAPSFGGNCPYTEHKPSAPYLHMAGQEVYRFAVSTSAEDLRIVAADAGVSLDDIKYFVLHQANHRILDAVRKRLKQPEEKFPSNIHRCGNTSSASVPLLLDELNRAGQLEEGDLLAISAFGAGLTTGSCVLRWGK